MKLNEEIEYLGKCLFLKRERILVIGDLHLGYEESLNNSGVFVSRKMFEEVISYLDKVFFRTGRVEKVVLLGDVKHGFGNIIRQEWNDVISLMDYLREKSEEIIIVKGNHDVILEPIVKKRECIILKDFYIYEDFCFLHGDRNFEEINNKKIRYWIMGHGHPAVKIGDGVKVEKYKCYLEGTYEKKKIIIVPSFFEGNLGSDPRENDLGFAWDFNLNRFKVKVVGEGLEILDFGELGKIG